MSLKAPSIMDEWEGWGGYHEKENPAERFGSRIAHLPIELRRKAWGHFEQKDNMSKGNITFQEAEQLAKLYIDQYELEKNTDQNAGGKNKKETK
jgi:hypothetical protein